MKRPKALKLVMLVPPDGSTQEWWTLNKLHKPGMSRMIAGLDSRPIVKTQRCHNYYLGYKKRILCYVNTKSISDLTVKKPINYVLQLSKKMPTVRGYSSTF